MKIIISTMAAFMAAATLHAQNDLVLDLVLDLYGSETTWELLDPSNTAIGTGGPYTDAGSNGEYPQPPVQFNGLADGEYTFRVLDDYGDGMCCAFGNGSYTLTHVGSGTIVASGGVFGSEESTTFMLPPPPPPPVAVTPLAVQLEQVASGFSGITDIANCGDDRLFVVQRGGAIRILDGDGNTLPTPFLTVPNVLSTGSEQGLLSLVFHPSYAQNGLLYVNYTSPGIGAQGHSRVSRFTVSADPNIVDVASEQIVYTLAQPYTNHNGGDMEFGPDGYLYIAFGDGGSANDPEDYAQTHSSALGTMLRIDVDAGDPFAIPADNPFASAVDTLPEIWATGLRNPWRFAFDELTGDMYIADVGQNLWEEVNHVMGAGPGVNYGWRCYEANSEFNLADCGPASDYVFPVVEVSHASGWCSITGGRVYRGTEFPRLQGMYLFSDFCAGQIRGIRSDGVGGWEETLLLNSGLAQASTFGTDAQNALYVAQLNGFIYRISDVCTEGPPTLDLNDNLLTSSGGLDHTWTRDGVLLDWAQGNTLIADTTGSYQVFVEVNAGCVLASEPVFVAGVGIDETAMVVPLVLHPNPATDRIRVTGLPQETTGWSLEIRDAAGRISLTIKEGTVRNDMQLSTGSLTAGMYLFMLRDQEGRVRSTTRFSVVR